MACKCKENNTKASQTKEVTRREERRAKYVAERDRLRAEAGRTQVKQA